MQQNLKIATALAALLATAPAALAQDNAKIAAGTEVYATNCSPCHGERLANSGGIPDLRKLRPEEKAKFDATVTDGKGQMPAWDGILSNDEIDQIWAYIRSKADN